MITRFIVSTVLFIKLLRIGKQGSIQSKVEVKFLKATFCRYHERGSVVIQKEKKIFNI